MSELSLEQRLDRTESRAALSDLMHRYAVLSDLHDMEGVSQLFVEDVRSPVRQPDGSTKIEIGRAALRDWYQLAPKNERVHFVGNIVIDFIDADNAKGVVYTMSGGRISDNEWRTSTIKYQDRYRRENGQWLFVSRKPSGFYSSKLQTEATGSLMAGL
ncbi:MAG: nuclear transport factor 2 family protein [Caulobacterales bacterium]